MEWSGEESEWCAGGGGEKRGDWNRRLNGRKKERDGKYEHAVNS